LWELEPRKKLLEPTALPVAGSTDPMPVDDFDALLRATRWTATSPYLDPDGEGPIDRLPVSSPFHLPPPDKFRHLRAGPLAPRPASASRHGTSAR
jgi:hypothetical protein